MREFAVGLGFPEGPIALDDGSVLVVDIAGGTLLRADVDGKVSVVARPGGGPNGAAIGPDGAIYVCNNGGFEWSRRNGRLFPNGRPADYSGGRIERISIETGAVEELYRTVGDHALCGPNDIVFDNAGGFWFSDFGKTYGRERRRGALYYARADGSHISEAMFPLETPNGVGLSPDEDIVYVADSNSARLWGFAIESPGVLKSGTSTNMKSFIGAAPGLSFFDSLAVQANGAVAVATIGPKCGITRITPKGETLDLIATDDTMTTNICFGGKGLRTAYITLSSTGRLVSTKWADTGLPLNFLNK